MKKDLLDLLRQQGCGVYDVRFNPLIGIEVQLSRSTPWIHKFNASTQTEKYIDKFFLLGGTIEDNTFIEEKDSP